MNHGDGFEEIDEELSRLSEKLIEMRESVGSGVCLLKLLELLGLWPKIEPSYTCPDALKGALEAHQMTRT